MSDDFGFRVRIPDWGINIYVPEKGDPRDLLRLIPLLKTAALTREPRE